MSIASKLNESNMEPTSNNAQNSAPETSGSSSPDYLASQIADARVALESTLDDLSLDLTRAADVRRWVRRYPWAALGTAVVAGFTLGHIVARPKRRPDDQPAESSSGHEREERAPASAAPLSPPADAAGGWRTMMLSALFDILRLVVTQVISASVRQARPPEAQTGPANSGDQSAEPNASTT
jgi:ElaB/YqjD/DUF883 family membrane-anchored ribosome-binding protein